MKQFFENIDDITYTINDKKYIIKNIFDINKQLDKIDKYKKNPMYYLIHRMSDGEKWETVARKYYKDMKLLWVIILMNIKEDVFYDFLLTNEELVSSINYRSSVQQITQDLYESLVVINDNNREIKVLKPEFLRDFEYDVFKYEK